MKERKTKMKCSICKNEKFIKVELKELNNPNLETYACTSCGYVVLLSKDARAQYKAYKLKERRLNKIIKEKIQEHECLTNHRGNHDGLDKKAKEKVISLYNEIKELIDEYEEVSEKIYLKK